MARKKKEEVPYTEEQQFELKMSEYQNPHSLTWCDKKLVPKPTRFFSVGEAVKIGGHEKSIINQVLDDGLAYVVEVYEKANNYQTFERHIWHWFDINKLNGAYDGNAPVLTKEWRLPQSSHTTMYSFLCDISHNGIVCDLRFQRDYVWTQKDVDALFDSMFDNMTIGVFIVYASLGYKHKGSDETATYRNIDGEIVEIKKNRDYTTSLIDGQQRLTTIIRFITGKIQYRGKWFHELNPRDQNQITDYSIDVVTFTEDKCTEKDLYKAFLLCNNSGVPMNEEHIAKVREKYNQL